jgi:hypothetical protein
MHTVSRRWGYPSSSLMGVSFAAGWVPCIGPILASILFLASDSQTALQGAGLLWVNSWGWASLFVDRSDVQQHDALAAGDEPPSGADQHSQRHFDALCLLSAVE